MRRRQIVATLTLILVVLTVLGIPLTYMAIRSVSAGAREELSEDATTVATLVMDKQRTGQRLTVQHISAYAKADHHVVVAMTSGETLDAGIEVGPDPYRVTQEFGHGSIVRVERTRQGVRNEQLRAVGLVVGLASIAAVVAVALAVHTAHRLAVPIQHLAERARQLGSGDFSAVPDRYRIPEIDYVATVLDSVALELANLVRRERALVGDISHQLRTGLTGLSMRIEELIDQAPTRELRAEAELALGQAERLSAVIDDLLAQASQSRAGTAIRLDAMHTLATLQRDFTPAAAATGRRVELAGPDELAVWATPGRLHQALSVVVDNALRHGSGTVHIAARAADRYVRISITDEGGGIDADLASHVFDRGVSGDGGSGVGLALARSLLDADGGRLELRSRTPTTFVVHLPRA